MAIDYNQDIAPLRQQYFPMLAGERAFDQTMRYRQEVVLPMQQQTMKLMQQQQNMDIQDLSFRRQQFEFDQAKKRAEAQNEALAMRPVVADKINSIFEDDTINTNEKFVELGKISMSVAPYMAAGSSLNQLFSSAGDVLKAQSFSEKQRKEEQLFEEKRQKELEARELSLVEAASKIGEFDMAKEIAQRSGEVSTAEEIMMKAGKQAQEQTLGLSRQKASEEATKSYISNIKSFQTSLGQLKFDQSTQDKVAGQEPKLDAVSKSRLKSSLRFLLSNFPSPDKFIEGRSDQDLLKLANDLIANKLAQYSPEPVIGLQSAFDE